MLRSSCGQIIHIPDILFTGFLRRACSMNGFCREGILFLLKQKGFCKVLHEFFRDCYRQFQREIQLKFAGKLYVADTNNSVIRILDLQAEGAPSLSTLVLKGVQPPVPPPTSGPRRLRQRLSADTQIIRVNPITALSGDLQLQISLPSGFHFTSVSSFFPFWLELCF